MAYRVLEVTLHSARDLKNVNFISRMEVYAVATISGDPLTRQCTPPDPYGGRHPAWNATLRFTVPPTAASAAGCLHCK
uniref:C2 domain-containing protein n=1 Tax=Oryza barthii TaxID=65489 RepID=A0A0D3GUT3_9ORYZ